MYNLSREQNNSRIFLQTAHAGIADICCDAPLLSDYYYGFAAAVDNFGQCELHFRSADRCSILNIDADKQAFENRELIRFNNIGLDALNKASLSLAGYILINPGSTTPIGQNQVAGLRTYMAEFISNIEMKASDAKKMMDTFDEIVTAVNTNGEQGFLTYLQTKTAQLQAFRQSPSRGTEENIPVWKLAAIAVFLGLGIYGIIRCFVRGKNCGAVYSKAEYAGLTAAAIVASFC